MSLPAVLKREKGVAKQQSPHKRSTQSDTGSVAVAISPNISHASPLAPAGLGCARSRCESNWDAACITRQNSNILPFIKRPVFFHLSSLYGLCNANILRCSVQPQNFLLSSPSPFQLYDRQKCAANVRARALDATH